MLNRRNLRIKIMQSLFAFQQCKDANYLLALDFIAKQFEPDLNSMEVQDKVLLNKQKTEAQKLFKQAFEQGSRSVEAEDVKIRKTVNEAFVSYEKDCKKDSNFICGNMVAEAEKIYNYYLSVLNLAKAFAEVAEADKKVSHTNFVENAWISSLKTSDVLKKETQKIANGWDSQMDKVRVWFRDIVRQDQEYLSYLDKRKPSVDEQKKFANHLFRKIILGKNSINDYFEEEVLRWTEDKDIVKGLVEKTVKSFHPEEQALISLHTLSLNWEEDCEFIETLFKRASDLEPVYQELIAKNTRNWEVERLPLTDRVILEMAIAELLNFPNIPVKVTINEYIELAKNYSTPKSSQFINGILDVIARELKERGEVKKSGRGLIDNK